MGRECGKPMGSKVYRAAVVGCGAIAPNHVQGILGAGQTVCALCDTEPGHARRLAEHFGLSVPVYTELEELLERERPDVLHLCTPHYLHAPMCCAALAHGANVLCEMPITFSQAALGATIEVPTLDGKVRYSIPEGTQTGTTFRLRGKGIPYVGYKTRGDQFVTVVVETPTRLTKEQRELLRKLEHAMDDEGQPKRKSFFEKLKEN